MYMPKNVVFLSGCHGSGKSTLKKRLLEENIPYLIGYDKCELKNNYEENTAFKRQLRVNAKYRIDYENAMELANKNPDKIILIDMCFLDAFVYIDTYNYLDWLNDDECIMCKNMLQAIFPCNKFRIRNMIALNHIKNMIAINPPLDTIKEFLAKRQSEEGVKWNEKDEKYLESLYTRFTYLYGYIDKCKDIENTNFLKLEVVDINERIKKCKHYLDNLYNEIKS